MENLCAWVVIPIMIVIIIMAIFNGRDQSGGEYISYQQLGPENSRRMSTPYQGPLEARHTSPSRVHPHDMIDTEGHEKRCPTGQYYQYKDEFDWRPYDWRPFEWRPYWLRRAHLCPSAKNCEEYASDNCIGTGASDYQSCYDEKHNECKSTS
jgi:hypothetical protein